MVNFTNPGVLGDATYFRRYYEVCYSSWILERRRQTLLPYSPSLSLSNYMYVCNTHTHTHIYIPGSFILSSKSQTYICFSVVKSNNSSAACSILLYLILFSILVQDANCLWSRANSY